METAASRTQTSGDVSDRTIASRYHDRLTTISDHTYRLAPRLKISIWMEDDQQMNHNEVKSQGKQPPEIKYTHITSKQFINSRSSTDLHKVMESKSNCDMTSNVRVVKYNL